MCDKVLQAKEALEVPFFRFRVVELDILAMKRSQSTIILSWKSPLSANRGSERAWNKDNSPAWAGHVIWVSNSKSQGLLDPSMLLTLNTR